MINPETPFAQNNAFRRLYNRIYKQDPAAANLFLLLAELADDSRQVETTPEELAQLMAVRFRDSEAYQL